MTRPLPPLGPLENHAAEVVGAATGRTLVLWGPEVEREVGGSVGSVDHLSRDCLHGIYDSIMSVGGLGMSADLVALLDRLRPHLGPDSLLHFCEPTIASDKPTCEPPHDVTGTLWAHGFSVIKCRRFRAKQRLRIYEYCWGRARLSPP